MSEASYAALAKVLHIVRWCLNRRESGINFQSYDTVHTQDTAHVMRLVTTHPTTHLTNPTEALLQHIIERARSDLSHASTSTSTSWVGVDMMPALTAISEFTVPHRTY